MRVLAILLLATLCCAAYASITPNAVGSCAYVLLNAEVTSCDCCGNQEPVSIKVIAPLTIKTCACECFSAPTPPPV